MIDAVTQAIDNLPEELRQNAIDLLHDMTATRVGLGDRAGHWSPSSLRIVQPMSNTDNFEGDARAGDLVIGSTVAGSSVAVHILRVWDSRALWNDDLNNPRVVCQSPDGKTGWRFGACRTCDNSKFVDSTPPACRQQKTFLAITTDLRTILRLDLSRAQLRIGTDLEKRLSKMTGMPFERVFELKTKKNETNKKTFVIDPVRTDNYSTAEVSQFLDALFTLFADRRKEELKAFYEKQDEYAARKQQQRPAHDDDAVDVPVSETPASDEQLPNYEM